jgi:hypothetical protein
MKRWIRFCLNPHRPPLVGAALFWAGGKGEVRSHLLSDAIFVPVGAATGYRVGAYVEIVDTRAAQRRPEAE